MAQTHNLGKVSVTPKGSYNASAQYTTLDIVSYNGSSYLVLQDCSGITPPNPTYYMVIASKGNNGQNGSAATIAAGTVTMLDVGSNPTVTNSGTSQNAIFNFGIPYSSVENGSITTEKLADDSVTTDKLSFALRSTISDAISDANAQTENVNKVLCISTGLRAENGWEDYRILTNTSVIDVNNPDTANAGWYHIVVSCVAGDHFHVKVDNANSSARPWCFVDASYNKLSVASANVVDVDIIAPTNSAYLICNSRFAKGFVYKGESIISPIAYANDVQKNGSFTFTEGKYIAYADGTEHNNENYHITNFIPIPKKTQAIEHNFYNSVSGADGYAFYDISMAFISGGKNPYKSADYLMPIPPNAEYVRFSSRISYEESGVDRFVSFYSKQNYKPLNGKTVVMLGDSIVGNYNGINSIPDFLKRITGANCINCAFGGSNMATDTVGSINQLLLPFRGFKVIESIVNNDYTEMLSAIASDPNFETLIDYYPVHVANLQSTDWTNVDIITLSFGTNDWGTSVTLADNNSDLYDTDTFGGAWRTALKTLFEKYPNIKVMIFGPIWRGGTITNGELDYDSDNHANARNAYLYEYSEKEEAVAKEFHVPFVNMYDTICFNSYTWKSYFPTSASNAVHPNANGRYAMSKRYAEQLRNL